MMETDYERRLDNALLNWRRLCEKGFCVSVCYGPKGDGTDPNTCYWSVIILRTLTKEYFRVPYAANNFPHAIEIALIETIKRGWINEK